MASVFDDCVQTRFPCLTKGRLRRMLSSVLAGAGLLVVVVVGLHSTADPTVAAPATRPAENWQSLFDGKTLGKWQPSDFAGRGEPIVEGGNLVLPFGETLSGVTYTGEVPRMNYEIALDAKKVDGADFFCGLTFPVNDSFASLICGGWGGPVVGISSLNDEDAARNETRTLKKFDRNKWYAIRLRVTSDHIKAWIDEEKVVDVVTTGKKISIRVEVEASKPLGIASYQTTAALRKIRIRTLTADEIPATKPVK